MAGRLNVVCLTDGPTKLGTYVSSSRFFMDTQLTMASAPVTLISLYAVKRDGPYLMAQDGIRK